MVTFLVDKYYYVTLLMYNIKLHIIKYKNSMYIINFSIFNICKFVDYYCIEITPIKFTMSMNVYK